MLQDTELWREACLIGGQWVQADGGGKIAVDNPATGQTIGQVPKCGRAETARAIEAAGKAWPAWRALTALERANALLRWHDLILAAKDDLARLMTLEQGKPLAEAAGEIAYSASFIRWFAEEARRAYGDVVPAPWAGRRILVTREPVGVCGIVTPWNFPTAMIARKVGPALAIGCPVVVKPASMTPFSALALGELAGRAGIPAGVVNILTGDSRAIGDELTENPVVRKLSFTGSTEIGKKLLAKCAGTVKKVSMELGGNAPFLVFDDADLDAAVAGAMATKYRNSGQTCICANRFYVQAGIHDAFVAKLAEAVAGLTVGDGQAPGVTQGPLIDGKALAHMQALVADATAKGGRVVCGGGPHALGGNFFEPTVIAGATQDMAFAREEIFGPIAPVFRFDTEAEAVALANDTEYGLAAYFYTRDLGRSFRVSRALEYGMVGVNESLISNTEAPFGGVKESGLGREGSRYGIDEYAVLKYTCIGGLGE
ncbi:succinic semialdehyde dehydrogenase [Solidesulfovibrio carbinoliphilus subsp. oakridgensis]|uniref:Succinic semialdehyde dehydrogenase n=1 Tax=Solidesulfovibrio carbinoliphilus subsp. oakridgensis TaxID=694327 RepID=G7QBS9_9BACT|nr:NAD-dependent succinate-semialdehyde dehydrogenase [Solidesulfovibrio carbinoliphilus]EHJ49422.1 succinic semialdehyde dehydrogenase [Solidesulfovibrio carbinoliphilus subsp. oakridgensis]